MNVHIVVMDFSTVILRLNMLSVVDQSLVSHYAEDIQPLIV